MQWGAFSDYVLCGNILRPWAKMALQEIGGRSWHIPKSVETPLSRSDFILKIAFFDSIVELHREQTEI